MTESALHLQSSDKNSEKSGGSLTLYSYWRSSCSWRVRIALAYKGLKYRYEAVNLLKNEHLSEEFTKLNPLKLVPLLVDDGFEISDSVAIMEYLEEKYPSPPLLPKDLKKRALVRQAVNCVASSIQPLQNMGVLIKIGDKLGSEESIKWAQYYIEKGFKALETILKPIAGKYSCGDEFSLADIALICQLGNAARFKVDMTDFPTLKKIGENIRSLPWVEEASPEKQPDAVI